MTKQLGAFTGRLLYNSWKNGNLLESEIFREIIGSLLEFNWFS